jgi:hypothetical protein
MDRLRLLHTHVKTTFAVASAVLIAAGWLSARGFAAAPLIDPPGFGMVTLVPGQGLRFNVSCSPHGAGKFPPGPCKATLMLHDPTGRALVVHDISIRGGESLSLNFTLPIDTGGPVGLTPCIRQAPGSQGLLVPAVEVYSVETGRTMLYINPASAHLTDFAPTRGADPTELDIVGR